MEGKLNFDCREDEAAMEFMNLAVSETLKKPISLLMATVIGLIKKIIFGKKDWYPEFNES